MIHQTEHPILPKISDDLILKLPAEQVADLIRRREQAIRNEKDDPYSYAYDLERWKLADLQVARRRLEVGGHAVIQLVVLGGIRSAKTHFAARRMNQHLQHTRNAWMWAMHETEPSSNAIGQRWMHHYLPAQYKTESGKSKAGARLNYVTGKGFTGMQFSIGKSVCEFKVYGSSMGSQQGAELTMAWGDELVPKEVAQTMRERVLTRAKDMQQPEMMHKVREALVYLEAGKQCPAELMAAVYHGVVIVTFTPKEGYSPMVAEVLDGAITEIEEDAKLLPIKDAEGKIAGYKKVPVVQRAKKRTTVIVYFSNESNPYGNHEGLKEELAGASEDKIRIDAYGNVTKAWSSALKKFKTSKPHVIPLSEVPRTGTFYMRLDPCDTRNFFFTYWLVSGKRHFCVREWPQEGDYIPGVGDPGAWAISSMSKKYDGDMGPAQESFGFGYKDYIEEWERIERELGEWFYGEKGRSIEVFERNMDSRFGAAATPGKDEATTLIEDFADLGYDFEPAPGEHLKEGIKKLDDLLGYKEDQPINALNCPKLYVVDTCSAMIFSMANWTGKDGQKGACKDPLDTARYHVLADAIDMTGEPKMVRRARASS